MAIVRHIKTNKYYRYLGNDTYTNLHSGSTGRIPPENAARMFRVSLKATMIFEEHPIVEEMVKRLGLVEDKEVLPI